MTEQTVTELLKKYRDAAIRASDLSDSTKQNAAADLVHECYKVLRDTEKGRSGIIEMMSDANPYVRLSAAADSLQWVPELARPILESLRDEKVFPYSFDATMILREYDRGRLKFDY